MNVELWNDLMLDAIVQGQNSEPVDSAYCVGCVIATPEGRIVSRGFSRELPGNTHAEECALMKLPGSAEGLVVFTTMEPCSKRLSGKKSCMQRILDSGCKHVVVGVREPDHFVKCEATDVLLHEGVEVTYVQDPTIIRHCQELNAHLVPVQPGS